MKTFFASKASLSMLACTLVVAPVSYASAAELRGMITSHEGSTITVRSGGSESEVTLTPSTSIRGTIGGMGVRSEAHPASDLIRGLTVVVTTADHGGHLTATKVVFKHSDLKIANQISAGIAATESRVAENADRIDNVGEMEAVDRTNILFATGSSTLTAKGKEDLRVIVHKANSIKGYRLAVVGRADTTGNAAANQRLSERRTQAVTDYLLRTLAVLPGRILPTAAVGSSEIAQDPHPPKSLAEARRVTVTIARSKSARK